MFRLDAAVTIIEFFLIDQEVCGEGVCLIFCRIADIKQLIFKQGLLSGKDFPVKQDMPEFMRTRHPLHFLAHIPVDEDKGNVVNQGTQTFLALCADVFDGDVEQLTQPERIPDAVIPYQFTGEFCGTVIHDVSAWPHGRLPAEPA